MTRKFVTKIIIETIVEINDIDLEDARQINEDTKLEHDLDLDSMDINEITVKLEDKFRILIPDDDVFEMKTVGSFIDFVVKHTKNRRNKDVVLG
jgi:acyl carrier protein